MRDGQAHVAPHASPATQSTGAVFMAITTEDFYRSSNGDRWQLIRDTASGRSFVRHEPNLLSGGPATDTDVEEFLNGTPGISRCGRSWINKPARMEANPQNQPESPDKAPGKSAAAAREVREAAAAALTRKTASSRRSGPKSSIQSVSLSECSASSSCTIAGSRRTPIACS